MIDPALRHLPDVRFVHMLDAAGAATDEDEPRWVDQHHADACSIGQVFVARHPPRASPQWYGRRPAGLSAFELAPAVDLQPDFDFSITVVNGTSMMPRVSSALVQSPIRSIEIGSAEAIPTAVPRSLARFSSLASARSISTAVGTASIATSALANGMPWLPAREAATLRGVPSSK